MACSCEGNGRCRGPDGLPLFTRAARGRQVGRPSLLNRSKRFAGDHESARNRPNPGKDRTLAILIGRMTESRVLLLYGNSGPNATARWHKANEDIRNTFLGHSEPQRHEMQVGKFNITWYDARGRRVILSAALGGGVVGLGDNYRYRVGELIRDALAT